MRQNSSKKEPYYNLILITPDALRPDHMGIYGYKKNTTPHIDEFAKKSTVFTNVYTSAPKTYSSFVSLFTGLSPATTKIFDYSGKPLNPSIPTLAKILNQNGYYNEAYVSSGALSKSIENTPTNLQIGFHKWNFFPYSETKLFSDLNFHTKYEAFYRNTITFLRKNKEKKFFLWIYLIDPHAPYTPPFDYECNNNDVCKVNKNNFYYEMDKVRNQIRGLPSGCVNKPVANDVIEKYKSYYDLEINYTDSIVGKILYEINNLGLDKNTIVVFYSDHGEGFDHDYNFHHGSLYESNVKIPLIIYHPTLSKKISRFQSILLQNFDIFPTILDLMNIPRVGLKTDGNSFSYLFNNNINNPPKKDRYIFGYNHFLQYFSISDGKYKYLFSLKNNCLYTRGQEEFYYLKNDPQELQNLIYSKPELKEKYKSILIDHLIKEDILTIKYEVGQTVKDNKDLFEKLKSLGY